MKYTVLMLVLVGSIAHAGGRQEPDPGVDVDVRTDVPVDVQVPVDINAPVTVETPDIIVEGTEVNPSLSVESPVSVNTPVQVQNIHNTRIPRQVPNGYFNYTPNFISCGRVIGFQYGNSSGIGSFGVPWFRDKSCDIWLAVNEAQENGHVLLSYAFMCEIKNIRTVWGKEKCNTITDTAGKWWEEVIEPAGEYETVAEEAAQIEHNLLANVEHDELEQELARTRAKVTNQQQEIDALRAEITNRTDAFERVQQVMVQEEEDKQAELTEFLKALEQRGEK